MTPTQKISAAMTELGHRNYNLIWKTSPRGKPHSFRLTFCGATVHGSTVRSLLRAARRHSASRSNWDKNVSRA